VLAVFFFPVLNSFACFPADSAQRRPIGNESIDRTRAMLREAYASSLLNCAATESSVADIADSDRDFDKMADAESIKKVEAGFAKLQAAKDCHSLLKKHFTKEVMEACKARKTKLGATLLDVIQSGKCPKFLCIRRSLSEVICKLLDKQAF
jgi:hypothetical protein